MKILQNFIKGINNTFTLEVESSDSIWKVNNQFQKMQGVPPDQQRLIFEGNGYHKLLANNEMTLNKYNIKESSTLHLVCPHF